MKTLETNLLNDTDGPDYLELQADKEQIEKLHQMLTGLTLQLSRDVMYLAISEEIYSIPENFDFRVGQSFLKIYPDVMEPPKNWHIYQRIEGKYDSRDIVETVEGFTITQLLEHYDKE